MQVVAQTPTAPEELARLEAQQAAEAAEYERLKAELQAWCLATAFLCSVATLSFYSKVRCSRAWMLSCSIKHAVGLVPSHRMVHAYPCRVTPLPH